MASCQLSEFGKWKQGVELKIQLLYSFVFIITPHPFLHGSCDFLQVFIHFSLVFHSEVHNFLYSVVDYLSSISFLSCKKVLESLVS